MGSMSIPAREDFTGTTNGTIGSSANLNSVTFPSGHIIKSGLLLYHNSSSNILTDQTSFSDTGLAGTLTTLKSSSDSRLEIYVKIGSSIHEISNTGVAVLVNNAGITADNLFVRMQDDEWKNVIETNLSGSSSSGIL